MNWWTKFREFLASIPRFFREVKVEMSKVSFPSKDEVVGTTMVVLAASFVFAFYLWIADLVIVQLFKVIGAYIAPPPGLKSPALWGTEPHLVELFGPQAADIRIARRHFNFRYRSPAHWLQIFRDYYGPTHKAFAALDADRQRLLAADIIALLERFNVAGRDSLVVPGEYLEVVISKQGG